MQPQQTPAALRKRLFLFFIIFLAAVFLMTGMFSLSAARSTEERELEDKIPKHLPIKVKIKKEKEKAFKDLKNEKWLHDFELEVTNTGDKPIYFLDFILILPEISAPDGNEIGFPLRYGRIALGSIENKAQLDDVPIMPGETYIFKVDERHALGWETFKRDKNKPQPKKLLLKFRMLNFGDGTGFIRTDGLFVPQPKEKAGLGPCEEDRKQESCRGCRNEV
jgi:hypothetical protein